MNRTKPFPRPRAGNRRIYMNVPRAAEAGRRSARIVADRSGQKEGGISPVIVYVGHPHEDVKGFMNPRWPKLSMTWEA